MKTVTRYARFLYFPALIYLLAIMVKITVGTATGDLRVDLGGVHAVMGAVFLIFGASICYFMNMISLINTNYSKLDLTPSFWISSSLLFFLVFCDATFGIHEKMYLVGLPEVVFFLLEGAILVVIIYSKMRFLHKNFYYMFVLFILFSGIAVLGDMSAEGEGVVTILGYKMSYEQTLETLSVLLLASAFTYQTLHSLKNYPDNT